MVRCVHMCMSCDAGHVVRWGTYVVMTIHMYISCDAGHVVRWGMW